MDYKKWIFCPPLIRILWHISSHIECQNRKPIKKYCLPTSKNFSKIIHVMIADICKSFKLLLLHKVNFPISSKIMSFLSSFIRSIRNYYLKKNKQQRRTLAILQPVNQSTIILWKNQVFQCSNVRHATCNVKRATWDVEGETWAWYVQHET